MKPINEMSLAEARQELIDMKNNSWYHERVEALAWRTLEIIDRIHDLTRWIPVEERLPDGDYYVNVVVKGYGLPLVSFYDGKWYPSDIWDELDQNDITHWRRIDRPEGG